MKRYISVFLMITILLTGGVFGSLSIFASSKVTTPRTIAIVFDNSGSMYDEGDQAWCRATYAMEVFASMLNTGDILQIYPMHPITVGDREFTMNSPFQITDSAQASSIREILTPDAAGTPIESIDCAISGLRSVNNGKKYLVVLTDGGTFSKNGYGLSKERTVVELDKRISAEAGESMPVMYLGVGSDACLPSVPESNYFVKRKAENTENVLSTLTYMCNLIFGRDTLPKSRLSGNTMNFDISMSKLIVFVQGENISDLKIIPKESASGGTLVSSRQTQYSTKGAGDYKSVPDTSLQGMIVTYENCDVGSYDIAYNGTATSVEVYYEPDADLEFIFTDAEGNNVGLNSLYEGEYKVSFGMKDAKTGKLISSDLLGNPHYEGSYTINGERTEFSCDGHSGEVPIKLNMNDSFEADLTVNYLSGYTITKNSTDFGWPEGGIRVLAPPLGKFRAELAVPQSYIMISEIDKAKAIIVNLTVGGEKLDDFEFDAVDLTVDCGGLDYTVTPMKEDSQMLIKLKSGKGIAEGGYRIEINAKYLDEAGREAEAKDSAKITLSNTPLWIKWTVGILSLLILIFVIWRILHIRVLPGKVNTTRRLSSMNFDGEDETTATNFLAEIKKGTAVAQGQYGGRRFGVKMDVVPGEDSYLYKSQKRRSAMVKVDSVKKFGPAKIDDVLIGSVKFVADETGKLVPAIPNQKPFKLTHGMMVKYSGTIQDAGVDKDFEVRSNLNFKKK